MVERFTTDMSYGATTTTTTTTTTTPNSKHRQRTKCGNQFWDCCPQRMANETLGRASADDFGGAGLKLGNEFRRSVFKGVRQHPLLHRPPKV